MRTRSPSLSLVLLLCFSAGCASSSSEDAGSRPACSAGVDEPCAEQEEADAEKEEPSRWRSRPSDPQPPPNYPSGGRGRLPGSY